MLRVLATVGLSCAAAAQAAPLPVLLVSGANNHDWEWTTPEIKTVLEETGRFAVTVTNEPAKDLAATDLGAKYRALVLNYNGPARWGEPAENGFLAAVRAGTGVVVIHAANNAFDGWKEYEQLVGLCWRQGTGHGAYHPFDVYVVDGNHPITQGMADLHLHPDELYHRLVPTPGAEYRVLLSAYSDPKAGGTGRFEPMGTVSTFGSGRVFHTPLGHTWKDQLPTRATWYDPQLRRLVARGTEWAATGAVTLDPTPLNFLGEDERTQGFALLFDGHSLQGWRAYRQPDPPAKGWSVRDAALFHAAGQGGGDLVSAEEFGDFDLRFQWRIGKGGNSGVIWHVVESEEQTYMTGPEYQVLDDLAQKPDPKLDPKHGAAALYDLVPPTNPPLRPAGDWNDARIVVQKGRVQHWLNGVQVLDAPCSGPDWDKMVAGSKFHDWPFGKAASGRLALQDHGDEVAFRSLRIKRL
jgi:type 1 glutamine amidotransferase